MQGGLQRGFLDVGAPAQLGLRHPAVVVGVDTVVRGNLGLDVVHGLVQALQHRLGDNLNLAVIGNVQGTTRSVQGNGDGSPYPASRFDADETLSQTSLEMRLSGRTLEEYGLSVEEFALSGGCFPIRVRGMGVIGTLTVSGFPQTHDHQLAVDSLAAFLNLSAPSVLC